MDTLGACLQSIEVETGRLRWAFVPDPCIVTPVFRPDPQAPGQGCYEPAVIGEQYVEMISDWWQAPPHTATGGYWDQGGCCDNDVHEHFKCLEEVALTSAYLIERLDGSLVTWNCRVEREKDELVVTPYESVVSALHANLPEPRAVIVHFSGGPVKTTASGLGWIRAEGKA